MDELAEKIGIDPLDFRLKNYIGEGEIFWGQGPTVKSIIRSSGVEEILKRGAKEVDWYNRPKAGSQTGRYRKGSAWVAASIQVAREPLFQVQ